MSNFTFLKENYKGLYQNMVKAESRVFTEAISSVFYGRLSLEEAVNEIYREEQLDMPYNTSLSNLMREYEFRNLMPESIYNGIYYYTRKTGNQGAHYGNTVSGKDALTSIRYLYDFLKWFVNYYSVTEPHLPGLFDSSVIPKVGTEQAKRRKDKSILEEQAKENEKLKEQIDRLAKVVEAEQEKAKETEEALAKYKEAQETAKQKLLTQKQQRPWKHSSEFTEAETREHLIDIALKEAGWTDLREGYDLEFAVEGMPITPDNPNGNGFVDYVLWDDNGLPLAVVEAKRTSVDLVNGKHQAWLYANCLEERYKQRPLIFYSNGYETRIWDDMMYSHHRLIYGFYTKEELRWALQRRETIKDLRLAKINEHITGRPYQTEAIKRVADSFVVEDTETGKIKGLKRAALLVMATGSGKTRTAASIVDILFKNNWVKRVLFLADRNALVKQAKDAFSEHLPELSAVNLTKEKENNTTRLVFSTYQSIINKIDHIRDEDERFYGVGHFDLVIVDEAHRSVYNKYGVIFDYFDSLLVGLTATPKGEIDKNTYELFDCVNDDPTFSFGLEEAVELGFLNPYKSVSIKTKFLQEGIKYADLSDEDKAKYEETFRDNTTGLFPEEIGNSALNKWLFNEDTINKVLDAYMQQGLKIEGGDKIGRTIIFAANQKHAAFIVDCFTKRYPQYPAGFITMIHNKVSHTQSLIDSFCDHYNENNPQIAVSVDMMDTGIDAPRVLNLIFFKAVRSYSKFWQMIGRGTRLCPDVFGPSQPKKSFLIFDACGNFEFFGDKPDGIESNIIIPITQQIFKTRLAVARLLLETGNDDDRLLATDKIDKLHAAIKGLDKKRFDVGMKRRYVDEFENRDRWNQLDEESMHTIEEHLSGLPSPETVNEMARRFDLMMLKMMQANLLMKSSFTKYKDNLINITTQLSGKYAIPQVLARKPLIEQMKDPRFYEKLKQRKMEEIREELRELIQYLDKQVKEVKLTDMEDELVGTANDPMVVYQRGDEAYKQRVATFVRENKNHVVINKLNKNTPITKDEIKELERILFDGEERGTKDKYKEVYKDEPLGSFIRSIVGLDINVAQTHFATFIETSSLNPDQINFVNTIIKYLNVNGTIDKALLDQPPFDDAHEEGMFGLFDWDQSAKLIKLIDEVNGNVEGRSA